MAQENKNDVAQFVSDGSNSQHQSESIPGPNTEISPPPPGNAALSTASEVHIAQDPVAINPSPMASPTQSQPASQEQAAVKPVSKLKKLIGKIKQFNLKKIVAIAVLVLLFAVSVIGAYFIGKKDQKIIFQEPPAQQLNLPPQAVVVAECVKGRGKQYVLPKDIPGGPIYDVVNDKVIAIEYNLNVSELVTNSDNFSNTILRLAKDYPIDHLSLIPIVPPDGGQVENALLVTYVVTKEEAKAITCDANS